VVYLASYCPLHFLFWHSCFPTHIPVFKFPLYFSYLHLIINSVAFFLSVSLTISLSALLSTTNKRPKLGPELLSLLPPHLPLTQPEPCCGPTRSLQPQCPFQALFIYLPWLWSQQVPHVSTLLRGQTVSYSRRKEVCRTFKVLYVLMEMFHFRRAFL
jgi:hypothetical protein